VTVHASLDVETFSAAGFVWDDDAQTWRPPAGARLKGLSAVGAAAYAEHPSTDLLTFSYRLPGGPLRRWKPGDPMPVDLFAWIAAGGLVESHNAMFERLIWEHVLVPRYGFPPLPPYQQRCSMATARVNSYPGALDDLARVVRSPVHKDKEGKRLLEKFSWPRKPTKADARTRILPADDAADFERLQGYCDTDVLAEDAASSRCAPMSGDELLFWLVDQEINHRGVGIDRPGVRACIVILEQALARYGDEFRTITGGLNPTQLEACKGWLAGRGLYMATMDADAVETALQRRDLAADVRRVLEIRELIGSAAVKKLYAMENQASADDRLRNLIVHHGARTGRPTGEGPQPLNLPRDGPKLTRCAACRKPFKPAHTCCPWCGGASDGEKPKWSPVMADDVLAVMDHGSLELVEWFFGDAVLCISGCVRGLFVARPGHELIASDYSAIEAVVIAMLAGEEWRIQAFRENKPIYLLSASKITGTPLETYEAYHAANGEHHPDRQKIGKVAELAGGFGGWVGAWRAFGAEGHDDDLKREILAWRRASPAIVEFWGGQFRGLPWGYDRHAEMYGVEGHAILAIQYPGTAFAFRGIGFEVRPTPAGRQALIVTLPSGRELTYHDPELVPSDRDPAALSILYWTHNSNPKYGALGWVPMSTFGGRLTENIVQAVAHDILRHAILNLRAAGYPCVLHVYDEIVCEIPAGTGSLEQFEAIMRRVPPRAEGWPVVAAGGWRGRRYRKG